MEDLSGRVFGVYRVVGPLGAGGMASVYKAYQPAVDRHVALKILPSHLASDPEFLARFRQEAKLLANLQHPHILPVHDFGESDGFTYIVMPFIETGTLAAALTGGPLEFDMIKRVITQVGDALDCAHAQGLVHRDVKPSNILLDERGNCLLADFGIAKILEGSDTLTATGGLVGTPLYMSPEQGLGQELDGRSDIYSLGVVLYEMATERVPYEAETPVAVVVKHIHDPLPVPSDVNPEIPEALQRMIFRSMHKEPSERFATAGAMAEAMSRLSADDMTPAAALASAETLPIGAVPPLPDEAANRTMTAVRSTDAAPGTDPSTLTVTPSVPPPAPAPAEAPPRRWAAALTVVAAVAVVLLFVLYWSGLDREPAPGTRPDATSADADPTGDPGTDARLLPPAPDAPTPVPADPAETMTTPSEPPPVSSSGSPLPASSTAAPPPPSAGPAPTDPAPATAGIAGRRPGAPPASAAAQLDAETAARETALLAALERAEADRAFRDAAAEASDPFPDQGDGTFLDRRIGVRWTVVSEPPGGSNGLLWVDANDYCNSLALAGSADWRLPTQVELDSLLQRLDPDRYPWGPTLWSADRSDGDPNRLWVTNSPLYTPAWSTAMRDASGRRLTHWAVCISAETG